MKFEEAKQFLSNMGFNVVEGEMIIQIGEYENRTPLIGVEVSPTHRCYEPECGKVHLIGTIFAIELMSEQALRRMISEDLAFNR